MTFNFLDYSSLIVNSWLEQHWVAAWLLHHTWLSLGLLFVALILLFRLFAALAQLLDRLWLWLLRSPILIIKSLLGIGKQALDPSLQVSTTVDIEAEVVSQISIQLTLIQQQQAQIIKEIAALKKQLPVND